MKDTTLGSEIEDATTSDTETAADNATEGQGHENSNESVVDNDQVTVTKKEEGKKEENEGKKEEDEEEKEEGKEEEEEEEEEEGEQKENEEQCVNNGNRLNDESVIDDEYEIEDQMETNKNDEEKNNNDSIEMNPPGWDKDYEIRINLLKKEINETEEKHEVWQSDMNNRKEEVLKRWEMIKKKHKDRLKAKRRLHAVVDSVLNNDDEETMKEEEYKDI